MTLSSKPKHTRHSSASHAVRQIYQLTLSFLATTSAISQAAAAELKVALPDVALQSASLPVFPPQALPFRSYKPHLHRDGDTNHRQAPFSNVPLRRRKADPPPAVTADAVPIASSSLVLEQAAVHRLDSADSNSTNANWSLEDPTESDPSWTFPRPFDSTGISFSSNTCPYFFSNLLEDPEFLDCKPLSLLLTTSSGLFAAQENATTVLSYVIDQTCKAPSTCERKMQALAEEIQKDKICGKDIQDQNQVLVSRPAYLRKVMNAEGHVGYRAQTALDGFRTYTMMREAACLKDETTDHYCMAESANNPDSSAMYWWYIGVGESLPDDTTPSCNDCEKQLMSVYSDYASDGDLPISSTYQTAAKLINSQCDDDFAKSVSTLPAVSPAKQLQPQHWFILGGVLLVFSSFY